MTVPGLRVRVDARARAVSFALPKARYSRESLATASHVFAGRADAFLGASASSWKVTLAARRPSAAPRELERLAREFANELLNQEYRALFARVHGRAAEFIATQALYCARGAGPGPAAAPDPDVKDLLEEARRDIARTMPKKLPPQGSPIPQAPEGEP